MYPEFPIECIVEGTPISLQAAKAATKRTWKQKILDSLVLVHSADQWASEDEVSLVIYDFPTDEPQGDVDNIIKLIQDALSGPLIIDDKQIKRVTCQRFLPKDVEDIDDPPEIFARALVNDPPFVYTRVHNNPNGEVQ
jgi:crossover junction endodeoxyribonuclease RusA